MEHAGGLGIGNLPHHGAVGLRHVDLLPADARERHQGRDSEKGGDEKYRLVRQEVTARAHQGRSGPVAEGCKAGIAPKPLPDRERPDQTKADRGNRWTQHATRERMQRRGRRHHRKDRPQRIGQRAAADGRDRQTSHQPFGARGIDDGSARYLSEQADDPADREHEADLDLRPFLRGQIDRHEGAKTGLHVGEKEDEPVEAALTFARWGWLAAGRWRQRHNIACHRRIAHGDRRHSGRTIGMGARPDRLSSSDRSPTAANGRPRRVR